MTPKEKVRVYEEVDWEGFDYAFRNKTYFSDVSDPRFHALREAYIKAADELEAYYHPTEEELKEVYGDEFENYYGTNEEV